MTQQASRPKIGDKCVVHLDTDVVADSVAPHRAICPECREFARERLDAQIAGHNSERNRLGLLPLTPFAHSPNRALYPSLRRNITLRLGDGFAV
jgi:hypothetical protein